MDLLGKIVDLFRRDDGATVGPFESGADLQAGPATLTFVRDNRPKVQPFVALVDFESIELRSMYCAGMHYAAREGDVDLMRLLPQWRDEGKVSY